MIDTQDEASDLRKRDRWCIAMMVAGPLVPMAFLLFYHYSSRLPLQWLRIPLDLIAVVVIGSVALGLVAGLRLLSAWWAPFWVKLISLSSVLLSALILYASFR